MLADILWDEMAPTDGSGTLNWQCPILLKEIHTAPPDREPLDVYCYSTILSTLICKRSYLYRNFSLMAFIFSELEFQSVPKGYNLQGQTTANKQIVTTCYIENHKNVRLNFDRFYDRNNNNILKLELET
jgi:hypothetical protein